MGQHRRSAERRGPNRPVNGDTTPCPQCGGAMEFNERFRFDRQMVPAWGCENPACRIKRLPARRIDRQPAPTSEPLVRMSKDLRAQAVRSVMKSKARVAHG